MDNLDAQIERDADLVLSFAHIFEGTTRAYGGDMGRAIWSPVTAVTYERHLTGVEPIGIYPVEFNSDDEPMVRWGCCDIDTGDWSEAYQLGMALEGMGFRPFVERSRSKGWHIWVFTDTWVPARVMRRALKVAYAAIGLPAKEANPKSENLRPNQLGNYVRLPYKGALVLPTQERQVMMTQWGRHNDGDVLSFRAFMRISDEMLFTDYRRIEHWASKWYESPRKHVHVEVDDSDVLAVAALLPADWHRIWLTGEVRDRSATFVAMAHNLAKMGWQPQQVFTVLWGCPWNKYRDRNDGVGYVQDIVDRAFS